MPILVMRLFDVELWANMHQTDDMTLLHRPLTFDVRVPSVMRVIILHPRTKFEVRRFPFERYGAFSVSALIGLVTLTSDLSTSKRGHGSRCMSWASLVPMFSLLRPAFDLG